MILQLEYYFHATSFVKQVRNKKLERSRFRIESLRHYLRKDLMFSELPEQRLYQTKFKRDVKQKRSINAALLYR